MPIIAKFYGIIIKMFFIQKEHNPPHFHAFYNEFVGVIDIDTGKMIEGNLPKKALELVDEWLIINKLELLQIWNSQEFKKLPPLD
jgi:hypothetical protein